MSYLTYEANMTRIDDLRRNVDRHRLVSIVGALGRRR
jgi:hypothetical protein